MAESFFRPGEAPDDRYRIIRDGSEEIIVQAREFVETLWHCTAPYLDADIADRAQREFFQRFWEMYLAGVLLERGIELVTREKRGRAEGPDLLVNSAQRVWVEAVTASPGIGTDAVPEPILGAANSVPHEAIKLRLRTAIDAKFRKYCRYLENGVVAERDPYVIAINAAMVPSARRESTIPRILSSVLPFGNEFVRVNSESGEIVGGGFQFQDRIEKKSGAPVATNLFLDSCYAGISAVLYSAADEINRPTCGGTEFIVVHNPIAQNPLPRSWLRIGREYWVEGDTVTSINYESLE